jgi:hypothetical protein
MYAAGNINITNITNVTNVTHISMGHCGRHKPAGRHGGRRETFNERPPKLYGYLASGALLGSGAMARMNEGQMCNEVVKAMGYANRKFAHDVGANMRSFGRHMGQAATHMGNLIGWVAKALS